jgi:transposase-like protein
METRRSKCQSDNIVKRGTFTTQAYGKQQRYYCKNCNKKFIEHTGFYRMRNTPQKITLSLDLFFRGLSTREVQSHLQAFYPHNSDHSTILRWIRKYSLQIAKYTDKLKVNTGSYIEVDEMEYHRRKSHKAKLGIDENWFIDAIDVKTRFMLSSAYTKERTGKEVNSVLEKIKKKSDNIKIVTTDGFTGYIKPIKRVWGYNKHTRNHNVKHNIVNASRGEGFNIWVERMHNSIRQRTQNFRGFHGSINSAYSIMKGIEIFYNFVRKHEALKGKTPSDVAISSLKFESPNRWLELIKMSN